MKGHVNYQKDQRMTSINDSNYLEGCNWLDHFWVGDITFSNDMPMAAPSNSYSKGLGGH